ncbi:MAG: biotin--[acetyl-CoA-carboxylase] ligase [Treponema sp.]|nr:biotin--[acetyl-CoA-carboxylase] ligase [Treponema sp.]
MSDGFTSGQFFAEWKGRERVKLFLFKEIDSTNSELLRRGCALLPLLKESGAVSENGAEFHFSVAAAESQSAGRGRLGREFCSPAQTGAYFSFGFVQEGGIRSPALLTVSAAVGVCRAIEALSGSTCAIKWVNDIYCNGKKVCGILAEGIMNPSSGKIEGAVIGIGINIVQSSFFSPELQKKAGGIADGPDAAKKKIGRLQLTARCLEEIAAALDMKNREQTMREYKSRSFLIGSTVSVFPAAAGTASGSFCAKAIDITDDAGLLVELADGTRKILHSGEVTLHDSSA